MRTIKLIEVKHLESNYSKLNSIYNVLNDFDYETNSMSDRQMKAAYNLGDTEMDKVREVIEIFERAMSNTLYDATKKAKQYSKAI